MLYGYQCMASECGQLFFVAEPADDTLEFCCPVCGVEAVYHGEYTIDEPLEPEERVLHRARQLVEAVNAAGLATRWNGHMSNFDLRVWEPSPGRPIAEIELGNVHHRWTVRGPLDEPSAEEPTA